MSGVNFEDSLVTINLNEVVSKDLIVIQKIIVYDLFSTRYKNQDILIVGEDGENMYQSGFLELLRDLQQIFSISNQKIKFKTVVPPPHEYTHIPFEMRFFNLAGQHITDDLSINIRQTRFVGALAASRFTFMRMRTLYELDRAFPGDTYLTFKNQADDVRNRLGLYQREYEQEISWVNNKRFDNHCMDVENEFWAYNGLDATSQYAKLYNKFAIEVVLETDDFENNWFTEKTARCFITGKPFVLMAGQHSLHNLQRMGFKTFSSVIGEKYDKSATPTIRLQKIIKSLKRLYNAPNRIELIQQMYDIAEENKIIYRELTKDVQS